MSASPRWGRSLVRHLLPPPLAEAIEGDLEEGFARRASGDGIAGAALAGIAALAAWIPGRRATAVEPAHVLDET